MITYLNPAVAVALGAMVLGEPLTLAVGVAFVLILVGSVLSTRAARTPSLADLADPGAARPDDRINTSKTP